MFLRSLTSRLVQTRIRFCWNRNLFFSIGRHELQQILLLSFIFGKTRIKGLNECHPLCKIVHNLQTLHLKTTLTELSSTSNVWVRCFDKKIFASSSPFLARRLKIFEVWLVIHVCYVWCSVVERFEVQTLGVWFWYRGICECRIMRFV